MANINGSKKCIFRYFFLLGKRNLMICAKGQNHAIVPYYPIRMQQPLIEVGAEFKSDTI